MSKIYNEITIITVLYDSSEIVESFFDSLKNLSLDIESEDQIKQVATISANNDSEVGNLIAAAMD